MVKGAAAAAERIVRGWPNAAAAPRAASTAVVTVASNTTGNGPVDVMLQMSSGTCYLGSASVTTAGFPLTTGDAKFTVQLMPGESLYGAASSAAVGLRKLLHTDW